MLTGARYATLNIGDPPQAIEMDLDMLSSDFFIMTTTSFIGPKFNSFQSLSHGMSDSSSVCHEGDSLTHFAW